MYRNEFEDWLDQFDDAWSRQPRPRIMAFVSQCQGLNDGQRGRLLQDLIPIDLEMRWRNCAGDQRETAEDPIPPQPRLEDYLSSFPDLAFTHESLAELIAEEYRTRQLFGDQPSLAEYTSRFPDHAARLPGALHEVLAELFPITLKLFRNRRPVFEMKITVALEIGRQRANEPGPYRVLSTADGQRLVISPNSNRKVSRRHVRVSRPTRGDLRVDSLTSKGDFVANQLRLKAGTSSTVSLPALLVLGEYAVRVEEAVECVTDR